MSSHLDGKVATDGVNADHPLAVKLDILDHDDAIVDYPVIAPATDDHPAIRQSQRKKVAIVGFAESHRHEAPFDDPDCEIWILNQLYRHVPRADRHFEIHQNWNDHVVEGTDHIAMMNAMQVPVYMKDRVPHIPNSVRYPLERVANQIGLPMIRSGTGPYLTSTVGYMIALAIAEGFRWIGLFGIDLIVGPEYRYQRANAEFLLGIAHGRGIDVYLPQKCALLNATHVYGQESGPDWPISMEAVLRRKVDFTKQREQLIGKLQTIDGALQDLAFWEQVLDLNLLGGHIRA